MIVLCRSRGIDGGSGGGDGGASYVNDVPASVLSPLPASAAGLSSSPPSQPPTHPAAPPPRSPTRDQIDGSAGGSGGDGGGGNGGGGNGGGGDGGGEGSGGDAGVVRGGGGGGQRWPPKIMSWIGEVPVAKAEEEEEQGEVEVRRVGRAPPAVRPRRVPMRAPVDEQSSTTCVACRTRMVRSTATAAAAMNSRRQSPRLKPRPPRITAVDSSRPVRSSVEAASGRSR